MHSTNYMTVDVEPIFFKMVEDLQILQNRNTRDNYSNQKWFFQSLLKTPFKQVNCYGQQAVTKDTPTKG
jgi:hypothetical protein